MNDRLTKTENNPQLAFENEWYKSVDFCRGFFDRCEHRILAKAPEALSLAHRVVEMAEYNGDRHLKNLSRGLLIHAFIAEGLFYWARTTLESYRKPALKCCRRCRADFYLRLGDLLGESRSPRESLKALDTCLEIMGDKVEDDFLGRVYFIRSVAHHFDGDRVVALQDAGAVLLHLSLDSPRGFFMDAIAFIGVFIGGDDRSHDELALSLLSRFRERIKGLNEWSDVRARLCWVAGHVLARLGDYRRARTHLDKAITKIVSDGLPREAVSVVLDSGQLRCRHDEPRKGDISVVHRLLKSCRAQRPDLEEVHVKALKKLEQTLKAKPEKAFEAIRAVRDSFIAPVPNRLGEYFGSKSS